MTALVLVLVGLTLAVMRRNTPAEWRSLRTVQTVAIGVFVAVALWTIRQPIAVSVVSR